MTWSARRDQRLPSICPEADDEIREGIERELRWLPRHPNFVAACIQLVEIPLGPRRGETSPNDVTISPQPGIGRNACDQQWVQDLLSHRDTHPDSE